MKIFLYWLGAMAEVGIWMVLAFLFWFLTRMDALEIIAFSCMLSASIMIIVFNIIDEIIYELKKGENNDGYGEKKEQHSEDFGRGSFSV